MLTCLVDEASVDGANLRYRGQRGETQDVVLSFHPFSHSETTLINVRKGLICWKNSFEFCTRALGAQDGRLWWLGHAGGQLRFAD